MTVWHPLIHEWWFFIRWKRLLEVGVATWRPFPAHPAVLNGVTSRQLTAWFKNRRWATNYPIMRATKHINWQIHWRSKISVISHQIFANTRTRLWGYRRGCGTARTHLKKRKVVNINTQCLRICSLNHNTAVVVTEFAYKKQKTLKLPFRPNCVQGRCCLSRAAGGEGARDASGSMISGRNEEGTRQRSAVIGCV